MPVVLRKLKKDQRAELCTALAKCATPADAAAAVEKGHGAAPAVAMLREARLFENERVGLIEKSLQAFVEAKKAAQQEIIAEVNAWGMGKPEAKAFTHFLGTNIKLSPDYGEQTKFERAFIDAAQLLGSYLTDTFTDNPWDEVQVDSNGRRRKSMVDHAAIPYVKRTTCAAGLR